MGVHSMGTESVRISKNVLSTYRYLAERTGKNLSTLIEDTLRACQGMYLTGAEAGISGAERAVKTAVGKRGG